MGGIVAGIFITLLYATVFFRIYHAYGAATMTYNRAPSVLMAPFWANTILTVVALVLTLIFWKWKSLLAITGLLVLYVYGLVYNFITSDGALSIAHVISLFIILLLITGIRASLYEKKMKSMTNPDVFN